MWLSIYVTATGRRCRFSSVIDSSPCWLPYDLWVTKQSKYRLFYEYFLSLEG